MSERYVIMYDINDETYMYSQHGTEDFGNIPQWGGSINWSGVYGRESLFTEANMRIIYSDIVKQMRDPDAGFEFGALESFTVVPVEDGEILFEYGMPLIEWL